MKQEREKGRFGFIKRTLPKWLKRFGEGLALFIPIWAAACGAAWFFINNPIWLLALPPFVLAAWYAFDTWRQS